MMMMVSRSDLQFNMGFEPEKWSEGREKYAEKSMLDMARDLCGTESSNLSLDDQAPLQNIMNNVQYQL
jgi:hypothetical protein